MPGLDKKSQINSFLHWRSPAYFLIGLSLFGIYVLGIWQNPPGYYVDESALSYNAYLVSQTGAGEFGPKFPLFFQIYSGGFTQYSNPTQIYLLAILFKVFGPGILTARLFAAACVFAASCLLGFLARRISGKILIGALVGATALFTPWLFEVGRLVLETFFYPMAVVLLLWSIFRVSAKDKWNYPDVGLITFSLTLLTYSYTIGRVLGPLLAGGLIIFAVNRQRIFSILKVWALFGSTLIPLIVYASRNPELTKRFYLLSYITPESTFSEIFVNFAVRFLEDVNPVTMLLTGDINTRHHIDGAFGSFYLSAFALAVTGMVIIFLRYSRSSWWWYVLYGLLASAVPGALTVDSFHTLRMIAYPIFLLLLMVPALEWLLEDLTVGAGPSFDPRQVFTLVLLFLFVFEATYFHTTYYRRGPDRTEAFDADFKPLYESAVARPERPIYLFDGYWGPAYMHAFWYATLEARDTGEFVHQPFRVRPPAEVLVLSSEENCSNCQLIERKGNYILYLTNPMESEASAKAR